MKSDEEVKVRAVGRPALCCVRHVVLCGTLQLVSSGARQSAPGGASLPQAVARPQPALVSFARFLTMSFARPCRWQMIGAEVPIVLAKLTEWLIQDMTLRAWTRTRDAGRKILRVGRRYERVPLRYPALIQRRVRRRTTSSWRSSSATCSISSSTSCPASSDLCRTAQELMLACGGVMPRGTTVTTVRQRSLLRHQCQLPTRVIDIDSACHNDGPGPRGYWPCAPIGTTKPRRRACTRASWALGRIFEK